MALDAPDPAHRARGELMRRTWRHRWRALQDRLDRSLVRGQLSILVWLGLGAVALAVAAAVAIVALHLRSANGDLSFPEAFWQSLVRTIDPGQITDDRGGFALLGLVVTLVGVLLVSTLISLINNRIERRVENVRRGRDPVHLPGGHVVLLGWSDIAPRVLEELARARADRDRLDVVVLAPVAVEQVRQQLLERPGLGEHARQWPVLRSGTTWDTRDLRTLADVARARSVVVFRPPGDDGLADTIKTVMAVVAACDGPDHGAPADDLPDIVLEVHDDPRGQVPHLRRRLARFGFDVVAVDSVVLRTELAGQVARRAGLSEVFRELLNFRGSELYLVDPPPGVETFGAAVTRLPDRIALGVVDRDRHPRTWLWPGWDESLAGRELLVLATDARSARAVAALAPAEPVTGDRPMSCGREPERQSLLVVGWNRGAPYLLEVLDDYAGPGSSLTVVSDEVAEAELPELDNIVERTVEVPAQGLQSWLDEQLGPFDHAIVLADDRLSPAASDADTFVSLLALRPAGPEHHNPTTVVAQLRERSNKYLARQSLADDLVVGDSLTATVLAQLSLSPRLAAVLEQLLGKTPTTIDLVPPASLGLSGVVSFAEVTRAAAGVGEIALGWRPRGGLPVLNPPKAATAGVDGLDAVVVFTRLLQRGEVAADEPQLDAFP